ncbi:TonB-dependent receptor plug domain-containing protein, partial [Klebsiella variicola]|uniref:TonB-dependent receptor plug domain-containing protein n=1 Tax=Klebsiella variicola TaxID=244366 RepID=UPI0019549461
RQDLNWISPDQIERIEVVRGPMSSLYGSDAMGGVINIITKRIGDDWNGSYTHSYTRPGDGKRGDTHQIGATFSGPLGERFGLRIGAKSR